MRISNKTEVAVIFERIDEEGNATMFSPVKTVIGYADKKKKVFVASDGKEYPYMVSTRDKYSFGLRKTVGELNKIYKQKTLTKLLEKHYLGLTQFVFYFNSDTEGKNINFVCEDENEDIYVLVDKDFESYKQHILNAEENEEHNFEIKVNSKELINEIKKKIIGQDDAIEDIVSIIWQNSKSNRKQNILLLGPTGVGKTEIIRIISKKLNIPLVIANAPSITQSGFVGESVEDILSNLLSKCDNDVKKAENSIIIIDEIDKLAGNKFTGNDVATTGVQDELLKLVEDGEYVINVSKDMMTKEEITINTKNITFVAIGAFSELQKEKQEKANKGISTIGFGISNITPKETEIHLTTDDLVKYGIKPELIGRFTNVIELKPLTKENLIQIMKNPNEELIKDKIKLLNSLGIQVSIDESVYDKLATIAIKKETGARGLIGAIDKLFVKAMNEISQNDDVYEALSIDEKTIDNPKEYTLIKKKSNK